MTAGSTNTVTSTKLKIYKSHIKKHWALLSMLFLFIWFSLVMFYQTHKSLPSGISMEGPLHHMTDNDIHFLYDLTYEKSGKSVQEQMIFDHVYKAIDEAEQFIVMDMFAYNGYHNKDQSLPPLSRTLTNKLIEQKKKFPVIQIYVNADEINTLYGAHTDPELELLKSNGIQTTLTDMTPLRDSTPAYSAVWRTFIQWFGQAGHGWLADPMADMAPKMTMRSEMKMLNVKANHRKVIATEKTLFVSTANADDSSFYNSNSAFEVKGNIIADALASEQAVIQISNNIQLPSYKPNPNEKGDIAVRLVTEGKTLQHVLKALSEVEAGDTVWMGMFYLAEPKILQELLGAAKKGAKINLILDPNEVAFGNAKIGIPNRPVASELLSKSHNKINIRWYNTTDEQYHTKLMFIDKKQNSTIENGSANYTQRGLDDLNLESNLEVFAPSQSQVVQQIRHYFNRIWTNDGAEYTLDYSVHQDKTIFLKKILNNIQGVLGFTTY
jgi:HKD family nuclease